MKLTRTLMPLERDRAEHRRQHLGALGEAAWGLGSAAARGLGSEPVICQPLDLEQATFMCSFIP